jgi:DNA-3-methyladenine glycosylase II
MIDLVEKHRVEPRGPFSLAAAREFAGGFPAGIGGGEATETSLVMAFPVEGWESSAVVELSQASDDAPVVARLAGGDGSTALRQALRSVSLDHDGSGWPEVGQRDPVIGGLQVDHRYLRPVCFYSAYEAGTSFVIGQRIARTQAARIKAWLGDTCGDRVELDGRTFPAFPRPQRLLEIREAPGLSAEKISRLHGLAQAALDGRLDTERLRAMPPAEALAGLRGLRGVGEFTAEGILLRGCGVADELPAGDGLSREAAAELYGLPASLDESSWRDLTDRWRPYRMWAIVLLRVAWGRRQSGPVSYRRDRGQPRQTEARER